jgi:signal transduction histidine kinase
VKEFLDFAKGRPTQGVLLDPNGIARKVVDLFKDSATLARIDLRADLDPRVAPACLDEEGIHACLANLVSNALDACQASDRTGGGHVTVATREEGDTLVFEVSDDGIGMDSEIRRKVFTNFFTTKGAEKGTGVGLLTTRKIVQQHGGSVSFESTEGAGSVFRLQFPRKRLPCPGQGAARDGAA